MKSIPRNDTISPRFCMHINVGVYNGYFQTCICTNTLLEKDLETRERFSGCLWITASWVLLFGDEAVFSHTPFDQNRPFYFFGLEDLRRFSRWAAGQENPIIRFDGVRFVHAKPLFCALFLFIVPLVAACVVWSTPQWNKTSVYTLGQWTTRKKICQVV